MSARVCLLFWMGGVVLCGVPAVGKEVPAPALETREGRDQLRLVDGSMLHGSLASIQPGDGIVWQHPLAFDPIELSATNLAWIRFENSQPVQLKAKPTCRFQFENGDEIFGRLISLSGDEIGLETWFGSQLEAPREAVRSITFLSKNFAVLYEGPTGFEGWSVGRNQQAVWEYKDGAFIASGLGTLGRDFQLSDSASIEFDLAWTGPFNLIIPIYTRSMERFDYGSSCYMFYLRPGSVSLQRVQAGAGTMNLGQQDIPQMQQMQSARFEIRASKEEGTLALFMNGELVHTWKDHAGFVGDGSGVVFYAQLNGPKLRISKIKVSEGVGRSLTKEAEHEETSEDWIYLVNRDKAAGQIEKIEDSAIQFTAFDSTIPIPLDRVAQIFFGRQRESEMERDPWTVRAYFVGGGTLTFRIEEWRSDEFVGHSATFGRMAFEPAAVRHLEFQPQHQSSEPTPKPDEEDWDLEEQP